jgi:hypothetical protein
MSKRMSWRELVQDIREAELRRRVRILEIRPEDRLVPPGQESTLRSSAYYIVEEAKQTLPGKILIVLLPIFTITLMVWVVYGLLTGG